MEKLYFIYTNVSVSKTGKYPEINLFREDKSNNILIVFDWTGWWSVSMQVKC